MGIASSTQFRFLKKIARFLVQLREIPSERREEFARRLEEDPRFRERLAENLLLVLDRLDDSSKPELIGKIFRAYILGRTDYETCTRLCSAVDRAFYADLLALKKGVRLSEDTTLLLSGAGLMTGTPVSSGEFMVAILTLMVYTGLSQRRHGSTRCPSPRIHAGALVQLRSGGWQ